ncbi:MAG TPA: CRISPR-associated helicase Cas3' [Candidatus Corynebacterium gallistercoris]|uniref:CRISPR-associated helicase Cas3 n=1 Tax=Candidatus Corynebacterium gallistercoris TaxID=2838530 RepID=A0A9D1S093_9CORY|nr:CRISPR-associated helicase Cas3' [Candidatus Corynebacterium gallistercoris]
MSFADEAEGWVAARSERARALWAKSGDDSGYLNLPQHLVDSACAAAAVWDVWLSRSAKEAIAGMLGTSIEDARTFAIWLAGIHDVGKACIMFQTQLDESGKFGHLVGALDEVGLPRKLSSRELREKMPHGVVSGVIVQRWLEARGTSKKIALRISSVADAHHGIPSDTAERNRIRSVLSEYDPAWLEIQDELVEAMAELTGVAGVLDELSRPKVLEGPVFQPLTGLVVMADWIASNAEAFPMVVKGSHRERLVAGMQATDLTSPWIPQEAGPDVDGFFREAFGWSEDLEARPVQKTMAQAAHSVDLPSLIIVEAETGVGKTEAALAAAQIIGRKTGAQGIYFAAPTMATANGLLERTIEWAKRTAENESVVSMYLAHSKNQLSEPYKKLKFRGIEEETKEHRGSVVASSWMSGRRRGLLSNIVVGTMDQVIMMALQQRYSMLRHAAMMGKIVIFDEVHAFDTYSSDYLETTLRWLAQYGVTVILMSATLPQQRRDALIEAYTLEKPAGSSSAYPLVTVANKGGVEYLEVEPSPTNLEASVQIMSDGLDELTDKMGDLLGDGGCALVICNTIARAQAAYRELSAQFPGETELHHAGFMAWQRTEREDALRKKLGAGVHRGEGRPERLIVVATQVAEQSLDIDADVLVTDIAPIDLIIQRIGRVHRHQRPVSDRPERLREPKIFVRGIEKMDTVPEFEGGAEAIYGERMLLATLMHLPSTFRRPDDVAGLVQAAYAEEQEVSSGWVEAWDKAVQEARESEARSHGAAQQFRIPPPRKDMKLSSLFARSAAASVALADEVKGAAQVRDAEPTVEVIPIVQTEYGYRALGEEGEAFSTGELTYAQAFRLASSTVRLPARMTRFDSDFDVVVGDLEQATPGHWQEHYLLRGQLALPLDEEGERVIGRFRVRYTPELGLEYEIESGVGMS